MKLLFMKTFLFFVFFPFFIKSNVIVTPPGVSVQEIDYCQKKAPYVSQSIRNFIGQPNISPDIKLPLMGIGFSGGGYRALICDEGFMIGAQLINLYQTCMYMAGVSGGTWYQFVHLLSKIPPQDFKPILQQKVNVNFYDIKTLDWESILYKLAQRAIETGYVSWAALYGAIIADRLFDNIPLTNGEYINKQYVNFSYIRALLDCYKFNNNPWFPFPLFSMSIVSTWPYGWLVIDPWLVSSLDLNGSIPTESFGSYFCSGSLSKFYFEESLATYAGFCGSAYSISLWDAIKNIIIVILQRCEEKGTREFICLRNCLIKLFDVNNQIKIENDIISNWSPYKKTKKEKILKQIKNVMLCGLEEQDNLDDWKKFFATISWPDFYQKRILPSHFYNYTYQMQNAPLSNLLNINLADAGMKCNLPIPELLQRQCDIMFIIHADGADAKSGIFWELHVAEGYAKNHGYAFPPLNNPIKITSDPNVLIYIFKGDKKGVPTIIYYANPVEDPTLKFDYTQEQFNQLSDPMQLFVTNYKQPIVDCINEKIRQLNT